MKTPEKIYIQENDNSMRYGVNQTMVKGMVKYIRADLAELTWKEIQDIWFITNQVLQSIPVDDTKWEEWMFSTQGRFTKALEEVKKYREQNGNKD